MLLAAGAIALSLHLTAEPKSARGESGVITVADAEKPKPAAKPAKAPALGRMQLQAQYAGPLQDTVIQRWRDPVDGTVCYIYLPVIVQHSPPTPTGLVQYGANGIGSISCLPGH